jgi:lipoate-protein ligase A
MAFDGQLFDSFRVGDAPILRFFRFPQTTLTLGRIEAKRIDLSALPYPYETRPTGGRAVLHGPGDLCYAVIASTKDPLVGGSLLESYRKVSRILESGINSLGRSVELTFERHKATDGPHCFSAPSFGELMMNGKKVVGSAQARRGDVFLQQGVILLTVDEGWQKLVPPGVDSPMTGLNEDKALPRVTAEQVESAVVEAFQAAGVTFGKT